MTQPTTLVWVLTGFVVLGSGACGSDVTPIPSVTEDASVANLTLRVEGMT